MPAQVDEALVRRLAHLARLRITDDEARLYSGQIAEILSYVEQLQSVNTDGVAPLTHPLDVTNILREDEPRPSLDAERALAAAPQREGDFFRVPPVLDQGGSA